MANISPELVEERTRRFGKLWMVDDLIRERARDENQVPILGYPKYDDTITEYEYFTGKHLDRMVDEACHSLIRAGIEVNCQKTVALYAPSDLSFVVTFFALFRLGCKVLCMSIRLGPAACLHLLKSAECDTVLRGTTAKINSTAAELKSKAPHLKLMPMLARTDFDTPGNPREAFERTIPDMETEHVQVTLIMHSSGSTGLPKPLMLSHRSVTNTLLSGTELSAFNALPWYHLHGLITSIQAMWMRKPAHLYNARLPLTADNLISALNVIKPGICHCVPYVLKLIAERDDGVEMLKQCKVVTSAGARTPDELGDRLVKQGVRLGVIFGLYTSYATPDQKRIVDMLLGRKSDTWATLSNEIPAISRGTTFGRSATYIHIWFFESLVTVSTSLSISSLTQHL
jgi:acyl-CoA synthetase (AMP-forming)/AMP-acid ligase II